MLHADRPPFPYCAHVSDRHTRASNTDPELNAWAQYVREARKAKGWTIDELADKADVSRMTVIRWERGETGYKYETVERVARALGIDPGNALAVARGAENAPALPPPLPRELAELVTLYQDMSEADRKTLLERVGWVNEWAAARVAAYGPTRPRRGRNAS